MAKRKRKDKWSNRFAIVTVTIVVLSMALIVDLRIRDLKKAEASYKERETYLTEQVEKEEERAESLEQKRVYVQTKQYIEKIAKEKLGLVNPDEILLKPAK